MADDRCPWCKRDDCRFHAQCQIRRLTVRVAKLEAALRLALETVPKIEHHTLGDFDYLAMIENAAREALEGTP